MKRKDDNLFRMIRDAIMGDPIAKQTERVDRAIKAEAEAQGEVLVARTMRDHYAHAAARINHTQKWWEYASTRQKAENYNEEYDVLVADYEALVARRQAEEARLLQLLDGPVRTRLGGAE